MTSWRTCTSLGGSAHCTPAARCSFSELQPSKLCPMPHRMTMTLSYFAPCSSDPASLPTSPASVLLSERRSESVAPVLYRACEHDKPGCRFCRASFPHRSFAFCPVCIQDPSRASKLRACPWSCRETSPWSQQSISSHCSSSWQGWSSLRSRHYWVGSSSDPCWRTDPETHRPGLSSKA